MTSGLLTDRERGVRTSSHVAGPRAKVRALLGGRRWPWVLAGIAVVVSLPAVTMGPLNDDFVQRAMLAGAPDAARLGFVPAGPLPLRAVLSDLLIAVHPEKNLEPLRTYGALPWWTCDEYRVAFWRPLASFTHWLDYRLFPRSFALMHVHSILWYAAVVFAVALLYRRLMTAPWVAGLAGLLYVLDDGAYFPTMWVANRNLLISLFFGILAILFHDSWRRQAGSDLRFEISDLRSSRADAKSEIRNLRFSCVAAPLCLLASVLSTEAGVATFAYLFAYEVALERGPRLNRALALVPSLAVIAGWRLLYGLQGYGVAGGGFYQDPGRDPAGYALAVLQRAPFLLAGQWTTVPPDLYGFSPGVRRIQVWLLLAGVTVLIPLVLLPMLRVNRRARFWLVGMYAAALPFCASIPMGRSLLFVAIGGFGLIAETIAGWTRRHDWTQGLNREHPARGSEASLVSRASRPRIAGASLHPPRGGMPAILQRLRYRLLRGLAIVFVIVHLPWTASMRICAPQVEVMVERHLRETAALDAAGCLPEQDLVIVNAPNPLSLLYEPYEKACRGEPLPRGIRMLAPGFGPVALTRTGPRRVIVRAVAGSLLDCRPEERMHFVFFYRYLSDVRGIGYSLHAGRRIDLPRISVEVRAVDERGLPVEAAFEFVAPLEGASLKWLYWDWDERRYRPFVLPAIGQTVELVGPF